MFKSIQKVIMPKFITSQIHTGAKNSRPTSLQFQNGQLIEDAETALSCGIHSDESNSFIPILASSTLIYTGDVVEQNTFQTFLAVGKKMTKKIRLLQINESMLKPQLVQRRLILDSTMMETNKQALTDLNKEFGSKRTKRQTETLEKLLVNVDNFKDQLEKTVAYISMDDMDVDEPTSSLSSSSDIAPFINMGATDASDVYTLRKLIPSSVLKSLIQPAGQLLVAAPDEVIVAENGIKQHILTLQHTGADNAEERVVMLLVLDALLNVYLTAAKNIARRGYQPSKYSSALNAFILENFTLRSGKTRTRPLSMKDKASCYIIVLNLLYHGLCIDLDVIAQQLRLSARKINDLCTLLFLHIKDKTACVKLPLPTRRVFHSKSGKGKAR